MFGSCDCCKVVFSCKQCELVHLLHSMERNQEVCVSERSDLLPVNHISEGHIRCHVKTEAVCV